MASPQRAGISDVVNTLNLTIEKQAYKVGAGVVRRQDGTSISVRLTTRPFSMTARIGRGSP